MNDRLAPLLDRFHLKASIFHSGALCGLATFDEEEGVGHLHLVDGGEAFLLGTRSGDRQALPKPALVLFPHPTSHRLFVPEGYSAQLLCAAVRFGGGASDPIARSLPSPLVIDLGSAPRLHSVARLLFQEAFGNESGRTQALDRLVEVLLVLVLRHVLDAGLVEKGAFSGLGDPQLAKALIAIHTHPEASWTLAALAKDSGMSRARFASRFHVVVGQTPGEYLAGFRLALADALLRRGRPVKVVAAEVGYGSASALARAFRSRHGVSPSDVSRLVEKR